MALINYIEPVNAGAIFDGAGVLIFMLIFSYLFYRLCRPLIAYMDNLSNKDIKYSIVEEKMLDEIAKKKGIDLEKEILKREVIAKKHKSFRQKMESQVFDNMFPESKNNKK